MPKLEIRPFADEHLDDAGALLAARHTAQREVEPLLAPRFTAPAQATQEVAELRNSEESSGAVALSGGSLVGYVLGTRWRDDVWGPNTWVLPAGHAARDPEIVRDLYATAAGRWVEEGRTAHYAVVPAHDPAVIDAWFRLGFGQQQVHALQEAKPLDAIRSHAVRSHAVLSDGLRIRRATAADVKAIAGLAMALPEHQGQSPVFSAGPPQPPVEELLVELREGIADDEYENIVAELDGVVVGTAVGCSIEKSSMHRGLARPDNAGYLSFAAVLPETRGRGVGRALGEAVLTWIADAGYRTAVIDWRATNLLASRTWPRLGFRPSFLRLHRVVGY